MPHAAKPVADIEHETALATRIADGSLPTVFDSLGRLRSLTASVTAPSLDEEIEKLLRSVQRLRTLQESLRRVASLKHRLMNLEVRGFLDAGNEPVSNAPRDNLNPAGTLSGVPGELSATAMVPPNAIDIAVAQVTIPTPEQNAPTSPERILVDTEIRELGRSYGQVDKYATDSDRGTLLKTSLAGFVLLVFLAAAYFFLAGRQPAQTAAFVDRPREVTALAARDAAIPPEPAKSNQVEFSGSLDAGSAAAQPRFSTSQDPPPTATVGTKPIESSAAKFLGNPSRIIPVVQQSIDSQNLPDELNPQ